MQCATSEPLGCEVAFRIASGASGCRVKTCRVSDPGKATLANHLLGHVIDAELDQLLDQLGVLDPNVLRG